MCGDATTTVATLSSAPAPVCARVWIRSLRFRTCPKPSGPWASCSSSCGGRRGGSPQRGRPQAGLPRRRRRPRPSPRLRSHCGQRRTGRPGGPALGRAGPRVVVRQLGGAPGGDDMTLFGLTAKSHRSGRELLRGPSRAAGGLAAAGSCQGVVTAELARHGCNDTCELMYGHQGIYMVGCGGCAGSHGLVVLEVMLWARARGRWVAGVGSIGVCTWPTADLCALCSACCTSLATPYYCSVRSCAHGRTAAPGVKSSG